MKKIIFASIFILFSIFNTWAQQIAFPGAEGYGKYTVGGRAGKVYEVTTLNATGPGSLGAAIDASGARTVIFRVSGTIEGSFNIINGNITIAGQTAPGDGICIKGSLSVSTSEVIIRFIRVRPNNSSGVDAITGRYNKNIILDHVSVSWSSDEVLSIYRNENVTIQWCMISEACAKILGGENTGHQFGGIWGNNYGTYHHNLLAHNASRNPRWSAGCRYNDYRNNVLYNWGYNSCYGGEKVDDDPSRNWSTINMIANYYKPGPATQENVKRRIASPGADSNGGVGDWYVADNYMEGFPDVTANNWLGMDGNSYNKLSAPWDAMPINQQTAQDAYNAVLDSVGCSFPKRDAVDARVIYETASGTTTYGNNGILDLPSQTGGWPELSSTEALADSDHDGMPDEWENANSLNPQDSNDGKIYSLNSDYTNLEVYINSIIKINTKVSVTGISISPKTLIIGKNETGALTANITPTDATYAELLWTSSNPDVATVNSSGIVTGLSIGTTNVIVSTRDGNITDTCKVNVQLIPVTGVNLPNSDSVRIGGTIPLALSILPSNASNKNVTWSSSDNSVATVGSNGLVTGIKEGIADITVTTEDGNFSATCGVKVYFSELPLPIVELRFDENTGTTVTNRGSVSFVCQKTDPPVWSSNIPGSSGASVDFGTNYGNFYVESDSIIDELKGLTSFTITGWVNNRNSSIGSGGNRIVTWIKNGGEGVDVVYDSNGSLKVGINQWPDNTIAISSPGKITTNADAPASNWRFFAVTYDSSTSSLTFFFGDRETPATPDKIITYDKGGVGTDIGRLAVGHFNIESQRLTRTNRMFRGIIDQIEVYDNVLTNDQITAVQNNEIATEVENLVKPNFDLNVYPNPLSTTTTISYKLPSTGKVSLKVYDVLGNQVATICDEFKQAGIYQTSFDAQHLMGEMYFARMQVTLHNESASYIVVKKLVLNR